MRIAVYLTGGIACYKAVNVVRLLEKKGHEVRVVMTKNAEKFVTSATLASLTKYPVLDDLWLKENEAQIPHVSLARWTELALVVPATANFIAKMANGIADDAASTTILATQAPKYVVPAMNDQMLANPATQRNLAFLKENDVKILDPVIGVLAEGYKAKGRMPEPEAIASCIEQNLRDTLPLTGKKIIVTAGGTREPIDPVRFIGNRSSGKMGIAIARAAKRAGADVCLIYGSISVALPKGIRLIHAETTEKMLSAVQEEFPKADALIMAAAVADWRLKKVADQKIKKSMDQANLDLSLVKTPDILKTVSKNKRKDQLVIGFAAETNDLLKNAQRKLKEKGADYIIANNVSKDSFGSDEDKISILGQGKPVFELPRMKKTKVADKIVNLLQKSLFIR